MCACDLCSCTQTHPGRLDRPADEDDGPPPTNHPHNCRNPPAARRPSSSSYHRSSSAPALHTPQKHPPSPSSYNSFASERESQHTAGLSLSASSSNASLLQMTPPDTLTPEPPAYHVRADVCGGQRTHHLVWARVLAGWRVWDSGLIVRCVCMDMCTGIGGRAPSSGGGL